MKLPVIYNREHTDAVSKINRILDTQPGVLDLSVNETGKYVICVDVAKHRKLAIMYFRKCAA